MKKIKENSTNGITLITLVITIIVLLILAGVSIAMLTSNNGILTQANKSKEENTKGKEKEVISLAVQSLGIASNQKNEMLNINSENLKNQMISDGNKNIITEDINGSTKITFTDSKNQYFVDASGNIENYYEQPENVAKYWRAIEESDENWYSYNDVSNGDKKVKVNPPKLAGNMKAIKYVGPEANNQTGSKWANAMTTDGSMFVWIPRYAYKITEGYHTNVAGTIEVAFLDTSNNFLNEETGELTTNVEDPEAGKSKWLVHPTFTSNAEAGGGFGEISGIWVGKFEATGEYTEGDASKVSIKPGVQSLRNMTVNQQYKAGLNATYGENVNLNSHMAKNSEWGATVYLAHSKYGINKKKVEQNTNTSYYTGGTTTVEEIYTKNKTQSTTHNATGIYDLNGGSTERTSCYIANGSETLEINGGTLQGDLYGSTMDEQSTSTKFKTVYNFNLLDTSQLNYELSKKNKGDSIYETSELSSDNSISWFSSPSNFPFSTFPFFHRSTSDSIFSFNNISGYTGFEASFRTILVI